MNNAEERTDLTTHADWGAGRPRLLVSSRESRFEYEIPDDGTTIGSAQECGLRLPGTDPVHAVIRHDPQDEYALSLRGPAETSANVEKAQEEENRSDEILRTGARFSLGPWQLVFVRDEFADHGRPFGGREGGEFSDQPVQPPRPDYTQESPRTETTTQEKAANRQQGDEAATAG